MLNRIKRLLRKPRSGVHWLAPTDNPWGVPVADLRSRTLEATSTTSSPEVAQVACSMFCEDGTSFIGVEPEVRTTVHAGLRFRVDSTLAEGSLFVPEVMEHKWGLYYYGGKIIVVRSWLRKVVATADVVIGPNHLEVTTLRGILAPGDDPSLGVRVLDYLLRTHAMQTPWPVPLPADFPDDLDSMTIYSFSQFGNLAHFASHYVVPRTLPDRPLRTDSRLYYATIRADIAAVCAALDGGIPADILNKDCLTALHCPSAGPEILSLLLKSGCPVDVRSGEGATPLMNAAQEGNLDVARFLLDHGADPNVADLRGFTSLHRAAEQGHRELTELLLARGAAAAVEVQGHTPLPLPP